MNIFDFPPIAATLDAAYSALMWFTTLLEPLAGSAAAAAAVILITVIVRAALIPTGIAQARAEHTRARIAPTLQALQRRFKNDRERLQRETMQLYADEKASPFAGCLPVLIQAPIVGVIYALFAHTTIAGHPNSLLSEQLLTVPLGTSVFGAFTLGTLNLATGAVFGILIVVIALIAEITRRVLRPQPVMAAEPSALNSPGTLRLLGLLQFATAVVAMFVPLAAGLYLVVSVTWTLVQRVVLRRIYPPGG